MPRFLLKKQWLLAMGAAALVLAGVALYLITGPARLLVAVGPSDSPETRLVEAYAKALQEQRAEIRLQLVPFDTLKASAEALQRNAVDLAVVRPDVFLPVNGLSMAILRQEGAILLAPEANRIDDVEGLARKRLGLVLRHEADRAFFETLLAEYDLASPAATIIPLREDEVTAALTERRVDAIGFVAAPTGSAAETLIRAAEKGANGKIKVIGVGQADAMTERSPLLTAVDVPEGVLGGRPKKPAEEIKTIGVSYRLMARADLDRITVAEATQYLFQMRSRLALATPAANQMKALDTDTATGAALPIHPGAIDYFAREQLTFMDRYGDWLWLALFSMGGVSSAMAWVAQRFVKRRRELVDEVLDRLTCILSEARCAKTVKELDELAIEIDHLVTHAIRYARHRTTGTRTMSALIMAIDSARAAIADRRRDVAETESKPALGLAPADGSPRVAAPRQGRA
jgi:TRAP-type uncharacterized transport system substrate-binding protein